MWNRSKSLLLSIFCTRLFLVLLAAGTLGAPYVVRWYFGESSAAKILLLPFCCTIYACALPGFILLFCLQLLLRNIHRQEIFVEQNTKLLRVISWCCIAVGTVALVSAFYYSSFLLVAVAAAFCGLIMRVVKNVFEDAVNLKNENDFTI